MRDEEAHEVADWLACLDGDALLSLTLWWVSRCREIYDLDLWLIVYSGGTASDRSCPATCRHDNWSVARSPPSEWKNNNKHVHDSSNGEHTKAGQWFWTPSLPPASRQGHKHVNEYVNRTTVLPGSSQGHKHVNECVTRTTVLSESSQGHVCNESVPGPVLHGKRILPSPDCNCEEEGSLVTPHKIRNLWVINTIWIIIIAVNSIAQYLTDKGEHTAVYKSLKNIYIYNIKLQP